MKFNLKMLFSPVFSGVLFIIFVVAMAVATFVENDFGAATARQIVYNSKWFELIFLLLTVNMVGQIFTYKLYKRKKLSILFFHLAFIIMIMGAAITRYSGDDGRVHIREGQTVSHGLSSDKYMGVILSDKNGELISSDKDKLAITGTSLGKFYRKGKIDGRKYSVRYSRYIPNASETLTDVKGGKPMISLLITKGTNFRKVVFLSEGESINLAQMKIGFVDDEAMDVNISLENGTFMIESCAEISKMSMRTRENTEISAEQTVRFEEMALYNTMDYRIVPQKLSLSAVVLPLMGDRSKSQTGQDAFEMEIIYGEKFRKLYVYNVYNGEATTASTVIDGIHFEVFFGPDRIELPFSMKLVDFVLDRYPGSLSPSGYKSEVVLIDNEMGINMPYSVYMNNILKHRGYRFYQSSFDQDEKGTVLSVNRDMAGMLVTYTGYAVLFLFILLSLFNKSSVFRKLKPSIWRNSSSKILGTLIILFFLSSTMNARPDKIVYDKKKADEFGKVLVQDQKGRTKPLYTLSNDILRKISRKHTYQGYSPMQVFLGLSTDFQNWQDEAIIKISNKELRSFIGITDEYASIDQLVDFQTGLYRLSEIVEKAYSTPASQRSKMDKELLKVDERVNIIMMLARGDFFRMFPLRDGTMNWGTPSQALVNALHKKDSLYLTNILSLYTTSLYKAKTSGNYSNADKYLESIIDYQRQNADYELPSQSRINAEVLYYKLQIFEKLFPFYSSIGLVMLIVLIVMIIRAKTGKSWLVKVLSVHIMIAFIIHTFGLGLRWYISGHSPMSNGYESLLFISWITVLAGILFSRKSSLTLAATTVLASLSLMVAHLSFMDPEITNLVPVLQSYWLTLHVSVITASYGFLGLGAILGLVNLILYSLNTTANRKHALLSIDELSVISYRSLIFGLYFLTIGTFLGAVWANESWGRYWGWDPKETWSLITMIVYAFVIHAKNIKGLNSIFSYNLMSVYAFASVLMTYFGVNYYISGLHSYAGGDPVPIPKFVYITVILLTVLTYIAYTRYRKLVDTSAKLKEVKSR